MNERVGIEEDWAVWEPNFALFNGLEIFLCDAGLPDGPGAEVHDLVAVLVYLGVQVRHAGVSPVFTCRKQK